MAERPHDRTLLSPVTPGSQVPGADNDVLFGNRRPAATKSRPVAAAIIRGLFCGRAGQDITGTFPTLPSCNGIRHRGWNTPLPRSNEAAPELLAELAGDHESCSCGSAFGPSTVAGARRSKRLVGRGRFGREFGRGDRRGSVGVQLRLVWGVCPAGVALSGRSATFSGPSPSLVSV
jgi:hypothetical protein